MTLLQTSAMLDWSGILLREPLLIAWMKVLGSFCSLGWGLSWQRMQILSCFRLKPKACMIVTTRLLFHKPWSYVQLQTKTLTCVFNHFDFQHWWWGNKPSCLSKQRSWAEWMACVSLHICRQLLPHRHAPALCTFHCPQESSGYLLPDVRFVPCVLWAACAPC